MCVFGYSSESSISSSDVGHCGMITLKQNKMLLSEVAGVFGRLHVSKEMLDVAKSALVVFLFKYCI